MHLEYIKNVTPDNRGRIPIGACLDKDIDSYRLSKDDAGRIILEPCKNIPINELWLYKNKKALDSVIQGAAEYKAGNISPLPQHLQKDLDKEIKNMKDNGEL